MNSPQPRREFRNIHAFKDLPTYRLPLAAILSILHRISGALLFLLLPLLVWVFDLSISSELSYERLSAVVDGLGFYPLWLVRILFLILIWAFLHHLFAGLRHIYMDMSHQVDKHFGRRSALFCFAFSLFLTVALAGKLFAFY